LIRAALTVALMAGPAGAEITGARYAGPTAAYGHGAVAGGEYARLIIETAQGSHGVSWENAVLEDTAPRLADLDGDGTPEVVAVVSGFQSGARVQVVDLVNGRPAAVAATAPIGRRHRWLAIAGIADLDSDGRVEAAYVDRPHLARMLRVVEVHRAGEIWQITEEAAAPGHTNHRYGAAEIEGGVFDCGAGPEIITADADWARVQATRLANGALTTRDLGAYTGPESLRCR
jgi:hypothetical protein